MTVTPGNLAVVHQIEANEQPRNPPAYVSARVLAAATAESITIPTNAKYVRLAANADIYYSFTTTATVPSDTDDGSACEMLKVNGAANWLIIPPAATVISVINAGTAIVTASFYTL